MKMPERICPICGERFETTHPHKKYCSEVCAKEAWRRYMRERTRLKWKISPLFRERHSKSHMKWQRKNRKKYNAYQRTYRKKWRKRNSEKRRREMLNSLSKEEIDFLQNIAKEQQTFIYVRKAKCEVPNCKTPTKNLVLHEVKYSPIKTVTLCSRHHAILHHCLLRKKKVRIRINKSKSA